MKERMKRCFEKNSVLLFFVSFRQKILSNFVCLFFFCFLFFCNKRVKKYKILSKKKHFLLSCVFYHHSNHKKKENKNT